MVFGLAEASCPVKSIDSKGVSSIVTDVSSDKEGKEGMGGCSRGPEFRPRKGNSSLNLQHFNLSCSPEMLIRQSLQTVSF